MGENYLPLLSLEEESHFLPPLYIRDLINKKNAAETIFSNFWSHVMTSLVASAWLASAWVSESNHFGAWVSGSLMSWWSHAVRKLQPATWRGCMEWCQMYERGNFEMVQPQIYLPATIWRIPSENHQAESDIYRLWEVIKLGRLNNFLILNPTMISLWFRYVVGGSINWQPLSERWSGDIDREL